MSGEKVIIEADIERVFKRESERFGWWCLKLKIISHAGFPDRVLLKAPGRIKFVELKRPGKKARALQAHIHKKLKKLGFEVHVIDQVEQIASVVQD